MKMTGWSGHALLGRQAAEVLPEWEKQQIKPDMSGESLALSYIPSPIQSGAEKMGAFCHILDWMYHDRFRPYCFLKDGRMIPHEPVDSQLNPGKKNPSHCGNRDIIQILLDNMVNAIRARDWEEVVRRGGVIGHFLQEPFTPGHSMDNDIFFQLFQDPDPTRHMRMHALFDNATDRFKPLPPRLMGLDTREAAFHLTHEIIKGIREARKYVVPVIQSAYRGEPPEKQSEILAGQSRLASFVTASAWHTAFCIAFQRFDPAETMLLTDLPLIQILPYFWHSCPYNEMLPGCFVQNSRKVPMDVFVRNSNGKIIETRIQNGFGMYGYSGTKFFVDGDIYPVFTCRVGLAAEQTEGQYPGRKTQFSIEIDSEENRQDSNDMDYGTRKVAEITLSSSKPLQEIRADLRGAKTLVLCARSDLYDKHGDVLYSMPHVAICEPFLRKKKVK